MINVENSSALLPADTFTTKEMLSIEPKTMCYYDITKVVMGGGINIFKIKYIQFIITYEVGKGFAKLINRQGMFEILETFKKKVPQFIRPDFKEIQSSVSGILSFKMVILKKLITMKSIQRKGKRFRKY